MLDDWTNSGYDPFASPAETDKPFGVKDGSNTEAVTRRRVAAARMVGVPGDEEIRTDENGNPINRMFADVTQDEPEVEAEPGFESEVAAFNLFAYLSRSRRHVEPVGREHLQGQPVLPDDRGVHPPGHPRQRPRRVVRAAVRRDHLGRPGPRHRRGALEGRRCGRATSRRCPRDIRHQGYSPKRSMLLVWENDSAELPELIAHGHGAPQYPIDF